MCLKHITPGFKKNTSLLKLNIQPTSFTVSFVDPYLALPINLECWLLRKDVSRSGYSVICFTTENEGQIFHSDIGEIDLHASEMADTWIRANQCFILRDKKDSQFRKNQPLQEVMIVGYLQLFFSGSFRYSLTYLTKSVQIKLNMYKHTYSSGAFWWSTSISDFFSAE